MTSGENVEASSAEPGEWMRLGRPDWAVMLFVALPFLFVGYIAVRFFPLLAGALAESVLASVVALIVAAGLSLAASFALVRSQVPEVWIDLAGGRARTARREIAWADITTAEVIAVDLIGEKRRSVVLVLRGGNNIRLALPLTRRGRPVLKGTAAAAARTMIEASSIRVPRAKEDPDGKFSRWNFPKNVSKDDALALVDHPPTPDDPLPIPDG